MSLSISFLFVRLTNTINFDIDATAMEKDRNVKKFWPKKTKKKNDCHTNRLIHVVINPQSCSQCNMTRPWHRNFVVLTHNLSMGNVFQWAWLKLGHAYDYVDCLDYLRTVVTINALEKCFFRFFKFSAGVEVLHPECLLSDFGFLFFFGRVLGIGTCLDFCRFGDFFFWVDFFLAAIYPGAAELGLNFKKKHKFSFKKSFLIF